MQYLSFSRHFKGAFTHKMALSANLHTYNAFVIQFDSHVDKAGASYLKTLFADDLDGMIQLY